MTIKDAGFLADIVIAGRMIQSFRGGCDADTFFASPEKYWATVSQILIIGEATKRLSPAFIQAHPSMPWSDIARMRDKMTHHYRIIDQREVWDVVTRGIPELLAYIVPLLPPDPASKEEGSS
jgi:uncharacterized protein with HEPN domain